MEKDKRDNKMIQGDNFVMYNDVIIPSTPEQQFTNEDLQAMEDKEEVNKDYVDKRNSYFKGNDE